MIKLTSLAPIIDLLTAVQNGSETLESLKTKILAVDTELDSIRGGTESLETIKTDLEGVLDMTYTAASVTMTGSEVTLFEFVPTVPSMFEGGAYDLTNMASGDTIVVKKYRKIKSGGNYILESSTSYADAQAIDLIGVAGHPCRYGVKVTATQSAGTNRVIDCAFATSAPGV